jgi:hydroxyacylglutathione hydrolase
MTKTQAFPYAEIAPNTYEIGEFDCASIFLLIGEENALVIDTGVGIGDLHGFIRKLTDKPLMVCFSHNHMDHVGGAGAFDNAHIHPMDMETFSIGGGIGVNIEQRTWYVKFIAEREKGTYPYNLEVDLTEWGPQPKMFPLADGQVIDLGKRKVTVVACPGHTPGSVTFLDENSRLLFVGDACNCNLFMGRGEPGTPRFTTVEKACSYLKRLRELHDRYDHYYNGHYDFRPLGKPLGEDVLRDAIEACERIMVGTARVEMKSSSLPGAPINHFVTIGRTNVAFNPQGIFEPK